jgi:Carboxypeptidase regulatory-like domain
MQYAKRSFLLLAVILFTGRPASAQVLRGTVLDSASNQPVAGAHVSALNPRGTAVANAVTRGDGRFTFLLPVVGDYRVRVIRIAYRSTLTEPVSVTSAFVADIELRLCPSPLPLDTLTVVAKRVPVERELPYLVGDGFYDRQHKGFGYFLTRTDIEKHSPVVVTDVLRGLAGVTVMGGDVETPGASTMFFGKPCHVTVVLDGEVLRVGGSGGRGSLDKLLNPFNLEAIEVYPSPAGVPVQYSGYMSPCGAIIAWSRR